MGFTQRQAGGKFTRDEATAALMQVHEREDGRGNPYFWIAFSKGRSEPGNGTDLKALAENRISVTPLRLDLTDEPTMTRFAQAFG